MVSRQLDKNLFLVSEFDSNDQALKEVIKINDDAAFYLQLHPLADGIHYAVAIENRYSDTHQGIGENIKIFKTGGTTPVAELYFDFHCQLVPIGLPDKERGELEPGRKAFWLQGLRTYSAQAYDIKGKRIGGPIGLFPIHSSRSENSIVPLGNGNHLIFESFEPGWGHCRVYGRDGKCFPRVGIGGTGVNGIGFVGKLSSGETSFCYITEAGFWLQIVTPEGKFLERPIGLERISRVQFHPLGGVIVTRISQAQRTNLTYIDRRGNIIAQLYWSSLEGRISAELTEQGFRVVSEHPFRKSLQHYTIPKSALPQKEKEHSTVEVRVEGSSLVVRYESSEGEASSAEPIEDGAVTVSGVMLSQTLASLAIPPAEIKIGSRLGKHKIIRLIRVGGMGSVYEVEAERTGENLALKVARTLDETARRLFNREVKALRRLAGSEGIVPIVGQEGTEGNYSYYPMPLIAKGSLRDRLKNKKKAGRLLSTKEILAIFYRVARALERAHAEGITHRDIKPENVLMGEEGALVADFGLAKLGNETGAEGALLETAARRGIGTIVFAPPEQLRGKPVQASDSYSLGLMLMEVLLGGLPLNETENIVESVDEKKVLSGEKLALLKERLEATGLVESEKKSLRRQLRRFLIEDDSLERIMKRVRPVLEKLRFPKRLSPVELFEEVAQILGIENKRKNATKADVELLSLALRLIALEPKDRITDQELLWKLSEIDSNSLLPVEDGLELAELEASTAEVEGGEDGAGGVVAPIAAVEEKLEPSPMPGADASPRGKEDDEETPKPKEEAPALASFSAPLILLTVMLTHQLTPFTFALLLGGVGLSYLLLLGSSSFFPSHLSRVLSRFHSRGTTPMPRTLSPNSSPSRLPATDRSPLLVGASL